MLEIDNSAKIASTIVMAKRCCLINVTGILQAFVDGALTSIAARPEMVCLFVMHPACGEYHLEIGGAALFKHGAPHFDRDHARLLHIPV